jgi:hypothetical protein
MQMEDLHFYYANYSRIFNDVITLRKVRLPFAHSGNTL